MLDRVANTLKKVVSPISEVLANISMVVIVLAVLVVVADVTLRRLFNSPIHGSRDLTMVAFSIIVFLPLAWHALRNGHIELDFLVKKFPKTAQKILEVIMMFITTVILGLMSWRLLVHGTVLQAMKGESVTLGIPMWPFVYLASFGSMMLTLAFLIRFIRSLTNLREEQR